MQNRNTNRPTDSESTCCWGFFSCCGPSDDEEMAQERLLSYKKMLESNRRVPVNESKGQSYSSMFSDWWSGEGKKRKQKEDRAQHREDVANKWGVKR